MYELEDAGRNLLKKTGTLAEAKEYAINRWGTDIFFDGDPDFGATEVYIYKDSEAEDVIGYITVPSQD